jgi:hypothetical protein
MNKSGNSSNVELLRHCRKFKLEIRNLKGFLMCRYIANPCINFGTVNSCTHIPVTL